MDDKRDNTNKTKRYKSDLIKQTVTSYLQKRNYPVLSYGYSNPEQLVLYDEIESAVSKPNSILYSCFNSDPIVVDNNFAKFISWLKDLHKTDSCYHDLDLLVAPVFCHLYLEILRGGHTERASNFFKIYSASVDKSKCDDTIKNFITAITNDLPEVRVLKETFRSNKYVINLLPKSVKALKKFLVESGHVVLLQVLQCYFHVNEIVDEEDHEEIEQTKEKTVMINGYSDHSKSNDNGTQKVLDAIAALRNELPPMYTVALNNVKDEVSCGLISRKNDLVLYSYNNAVHVRSLLTLKQLPGTDSYGEAVLLGHSGRIYDLALITSYRCVVSASQDKTIHLFDLNDFSLKTVYRGHEHPVYCVAASDNGEYIASGSYDHSARLWSTTRKDVLRVYAGHVQEITSIAFHPNSTYFVTGSADKNIRMWTLKDAEPVRLYTGSTGAIYSLCYNSSQNSASRYLASAGEDAKLRIWDLVAGKLFAEIKTGSEIVTKIAISDDNKFCLTGSIDGNIKCWDFDSIIKNPHDSNNYDSVLYTSLNAKLHCVEYSCDTFACLTTPLSSTS